MRGPTGMRACQRAGERAQPRTVRSARLGGLPRSGHHVPATPVQVELAKLVPLAISGRQVKRDEGAFRTRVDAVRAVRPGLPNLGVLEGET